jgi:quercetin dioxygenase-like cupin family protein
MKAFLSIFSVVAITFCLVGRASAQDPVKVAPNQYRLAFNNDRVRVLDVTIKPGGKSPMHSHPDYVVYAMGPAKAKFTAADGTTREVTMKAGECRWIKGETHAAENTGKTDIHVLNIEFKK